MLTERARQAVRDASANKRVTLIVTILGPKGPLDLMATKRNVRDEVTRRDPAGVRIINELTGTPNMIVSAPARMWKRAIRQHWDAFDDPMIEFGANEQAFGVQ